MGALPLFTSATNATALCLTHTHSRLWRRSGTPRDFYGEKAARLYTPFERCYVACFRGKLAAATRALDDEGNAGARAWIAATGTGTDTE